MTTETAIAREFELIVTKYGTWSLEVADATSVIGGDPEGESNDDVLRRLETTRKTGRSWRFNIKPDPASDAPPLWSRDV